MRFIIILMCHHILSVVEGQSQIFETSIKFPLPFYNEIAPCPCDLTEELCDLQCCCDQDCSSDFHGNWTCIEGLNGGQNPGQFIANNCSYEPGLFDSDWNSILCLVKSRSSYLGLFYEEPTEYESLKPSTTSPLGNFAHKQESFANFPIYKYGNSIRVVYNTTQGIYGLLNLPQKVGMSGCIWSPIQYLQEFTSKCSIKISSDNCAKNSLFDYQMYLLPLPKGMDVGNIPKVLKQPNVNDVVPVDVNYYASLDPSLYQSNTASSDNTEAASAETIIDSHHHTFEKFRSSSDDNCVLIEQFARDDFYQEDQVHLMDSNKCINAVLEVNYKLHWRSNEIIKITANILLGNLTVNNDDHIQLHQTFSVDFVHAPSKPKDSKRTGYPGYVKGDIIKGVNNITEGTMVPKLWGHSSLQPITFLENTKSGHLLSLTRRNFTSCEVLSEKIRRYQEQLVDLNMMIAKGLDQEEFVPLIFEDHSNISQPSNNISCLIPSRLHVEVMYSYSLNIYRINGFKVSYLPEKWSWTCRHRCDQFNYELKSSVHFIEVPVVWHYQNTSKFWILQTLHECDDDGDKCWQMLFFPFTHNETGDMVVYAAKCAVIMFPSSLFLLWFTRDLW